MNDEGSAGLRGKTGGGKRDRHGVTKMMDAKNLTLTAASKSERLNSGAKAAPSRSTASRRRGTSNRIDDPGECRVQLFERNEFQVCMSKCT